MIEPFQAYQQFSALRNHFTTSYDYFKYNGKVRLTELSFRKRRDCYSFAKLSKMDNIEQRVVCCLIKGKKWITDVVGNDGYTLYTAHSDLMSNLGSCVSEYLTSIDNIKQAINHNSMPPLFSMYLRNEIPLEMLVILDNMFNLVGMWQQTLKANPLWDNTKQLISNYRPFFRYDKKAIHQIIVDFCINNQ